MIASALNTAVSALNANVRRVQSIAENTVNLTTDGFAPTEVRTVSQTGRSGGFNSVVGGGVNAVVIESADNAPESQFARLIQARTAYAFAAETVQTAQELSRETLNIGA